MKPKDLYKTKAWKYFSRCVLLEESDGLVTQCITCGKVLYINERNCHCGHLIRITDSMATALERCGVGPQCYQCNRLKGGCQDIMKERLIKKHGKKAIDDLYIKKHNICKLGKSELDILADIYEKEFNRLVELKGNPWKK